MTDYTSTVTEITVHRADRDPLLAGAISVQLIGDRNGGYFIRLEQEDQQIEVEHEELPHLLKAATKLLKSAGVQSASS